MIRLLFSTFLTGALVGQPLTYDPNPIGSLEQPLILRTYLPDPGLGPAVLAHHGRAAQSPKYSPREGQDQPGEYEMIRVIPAAIAVSHGPALSYVFDTTECRLLYAWQGGFLDMFPYWGEENGGRRRSFDYVPRLIGHLFYQANSDSSQPPEEPPRFLGYDLANGSPTFRYLSEGEEQSLRIEPVTTQPLSFRQILTIEGQSENTVITGKVLSHHSGFDRALKIKEPTLAAGEQVYLAYGCIACHSTDGSQGHGPTLAGLFEETRELANGTSVRADRAYLTESILSPNAKTAKGFPPNYMPPYQLKDKELASLLLFIQSLSPSPSE